MNLGLAPSARRSPYQPGLNMSSSAQEAAAFLSFIGMILLSMVLASNASIDHWPGGTSQATHAGVSCQVDAQSQGSALPKSETRNTVQ
jgi:hypothetical protein